MVNSLRNVDVNFLMTRLIRIIIPVITSTWNEEVKKFCEEIKEPDTVISVVNLEKGPESIESYFDEAFAAPYVALEVIRAEKEGCDAAIVYCFGNPGVNAARAAVNIPVFGAGEVALMTAALIANKFSIISTVEAAIPRCLRTVKLLGVEDKLASIRIVNMPVMELSRKGELLNAALEAGRQALKDGADVIVLGCTGMSGIRGSLEEKLKVPIIDPGETTLKIVEAILSLNLKHSKLYFKHDFRKKILF